MERDVIYTANANSIGSPTLWLKADKGVTLVDGYVSNWADQSGNGYNASQTASTCQPLFVNNVLSGKPVLRFDGINDLLATTSNITVRSIFIVANYLGGNTFTGEGYICRRTTYTSEVGYYFLAANPATTYLINDATYSAFYNTLYINGVNTSNASPLINYKVICGLASFLPTVSNGINIGYNIQGLSYLNGDISEIIIYDTLLTTAQRISVENYLKNKYSI